MTLRGAVRSTVERWTPGGARLFRAMRDRLTLRLARTRRLGDGTLLVGGANVADPAFEAEERKLVAEALASTDVFVDVGANVGLYTVMARSRGVRVIAIEPHPLNLALLRRSIAANGWDDVEICAAGVGRSPATASLYGGATGASLLRHWAAASEAHVQTIAITTLDTLLAGRFAGLRLFVKIDIEGGEYDALCGARELLRREPHPRWLVEITLDEHRPSRNPHFAATFDLFFDAGYRAFTAERAKRDVTRADVHDWLAHGSIADGVHNFLFV